MSPFQAYTRELREAIGPPTFQPVYSRILWLPSHLIVIGASIAALIVADMGIGMRLLLAAVIGHSYVCLTLLAHEIYHGSVLRNRRLQDLFGTICLLPFCVPPGLWRAWHNRFHHGHTCEKGIDPDGFSDPVLYRRSRLLRSILAIMPGSRTWRSVLYFFFYFSIQVLFVLFVHSRKFSYWCKERRRRQIQLFLCLVLFWVTVFFAIGSYHFMFVYVVPMMIANSIQMMYVTTNHWLCDETPDGNDPLRNTLSVKLPRIIDWLHLNTSYHVEHHLAPTMSPRHAPVIREVMERKHGKRCRRLSLLQILRMTFHTPRVHLSEKELVDIDTGMVFSTLGPEAEPPHLVDRVPVPVKRRRLSQSKPQGCVLRKAA